MIAPEYRSRVDLLLRLLPTIAEESTLALKGGTAINLFVRDMPRLSIDIDLTYLPLEDRDVSLKACIPAECQERRACLKIIFQPRLTEYAGRQMEAKQHRAAQESRKEACRTI